MSKPLQILMTTNEFIKYTIQYNIKNNIEEFQAKVYLKKFNALLNGIFMVVRKSIILKTAQCMHI